MKKINSIQLGDIEGRLIYNNGNELWDSAKNGVLERRMATNKEKRDLIINSKWIAFLSNRERRAVGGILRGSEEPKNEVIKGKDLENAEIEDIIKDFASIKVKRKAINQELEQRAALDSDAIKEKCSNISKKKEDINETSPKGKCLKSKILAMWTDLKGSLLRRRSLMKKDYGEKSPISFFQRITFSGWSSGWKLNAMRYLKYNYQG